MVSTGRASRAAYRESRVVVCQTNTSDDRRDGRRGGLAPERLGDEHHVAVRCSRRSLFEVRCSRFAVRRFTEVLVARGSASSRPSRPTTNSLASFVNTPIRVNGGLATRLMHRAQQPARAFGHGKQQLVVVAADDRRANRIDAPRGPPRRAPPDRSEGMTHPRERRIRWRRRPAAARRRARRSSPWRLAPRALDPSRVQAALAARDVDAARCRCLRQSGLAEAR